MTAQQPQGHAGLPLRTAANHRSAQTPATSHGFLNAVARGFFELTHSGLALLGVSLVLALGLLMVRADWRAQAEELVLDWLQQRQVQQAEGAPSEVGAAKAVAIEGEPAANDRATALAPSTLPQQQLKVVNWLSRKYRVAPEPLSALVTEAYALGSRMSIDPTLLLAVMAIESRFNPFAQSAVGAQGLMQVLTRVHTEKYDHFGGTMAAFDPLANLRVGAQILHGYVRRAGSIEGGLRLYVGAVSTDGRWYIDKVLSEQQRLLSVAQGRPMPRELPRTLAPAAVPQPVLIEEALQIPATETQPAPVEPEPAQLG